MRAGSFRGGLSPFGAGTLDRTAALATLTQPGGSTGSTPSFFKALGPPTGPGGAPLPAPSAGVGNGTRNIVDRSTGTYVRPVPHAAPTVIARAATRAAATTRTATTRTATRPAASRAPTALKPTRARPTAKRPLPKPPAKRATRSTTSRLVAF